MHTQPKKCSAPRNLEIKTSLNADEYLQFKSKCEAAGIAVATRIRVLINRDADAANRNRAAWRRERPAFGRIQAVFPAAHGRFGAPAHRPRL